jgi:hypothetical protein
LERHTGEKSGDSCKTSASCIFTSKYVLSFS